MLGYQLIALEQGRTSRVDNRRHGDSLARACLHQQVFIVKAGLKYDEADVSGKLCPGHTTMGSGERRPTVDFRTIGGNAKALLGYPITHQN